MHFEAHTYKHNTHSRPLKGTIPTPKPTPIPTNNPPPPLKHTHTHTYIHTPATLKLKRKCVIFVCLTPWKSSLLMLSVFTCSVHK